jgi:hypothetical protein
MVRNKASYFFSFKLSLLQPLGRRTDWCSRLNCNHATSGGNSCRDLPQEGPKTKRNEVDEFSKTEIGVIMIMSKPLVTALLTFLTS